MKRVFLNMLALSAGFYILIYVLVQLVGVSVFVDMDILISKHFYQNMIFYYIAVFIIFSFGGVCYLLFYVITRLKIVSLLMAVAVNLYMVYYLKIDNLYFGLTVIDTMSLEEVYRLCNVLKKGERYCDNNRYIYACRCRLEKEGIV